MRKKKLTDYSVYVYTLRDWVILAVILAALAFLFGIVFFRDVMVGILFALISSPFVYIRLRQYLKRKRIHKLERQFCDVLNLMAASLSAGQSLTGAINEITFDEYGDYSLIRKEFRNISRLISLNIPPEDAINVFAKRSGSKDIQSFANAMYASISAGSNLVWLVRNASGQLRVKYDAEAEIRGILNLPKFNHRIMMLMPFAMVLMMKFIAPGYVKPLYSSQGKGIMVFVALMVLISWFIGEKISDIRI